MSDVFSVSAAYNKSSYSVGETITATISGTNTHTTPDETVTGTAGPVNIPVVSDSGAASVVNLPQVNVTHVVPGTTAVEDVLIDTNAFVTNQGDRTWAVSADRKSITAVA